MTHGFIFENGEYTHLFIESMKAAHAQHHDSSDTVTSESEIRGRWLLMLTTWLVMLIHFLTIVENNTFRLMEQFAVRWTGEKKNPTKTSFLCSYQMENLHNNRLEIANKTAHLCEFKEDMQCLHWRSTRLNESLCFVSVMFGAVTHLGWMDGVFHMWDFFSVLFVIFASEFTNMFVTVVCILQIQMEKKPEGIS